MSSIVIGQGGLRKTILIAVVLRQVGSSTVLLSTLSSSNELNRDLSSLKIDRLAVVFYELTFTPNYSDRACSLNYIVVPFVKIAVA